MLGLLCWRFDPADRSLVEVTCLLVASGRRRRGIGRALLEAAHDALRDAGGRATWLVTTNDNEPAIHLYESLGYVVTEIRRGAIDEIRRTIKPSIPLVGHGGVEMHDELELRRPILGR
jgi:ribosomal protein S18 acetylase RimI-like enzyme